MRWPTVGFCIVNCRMTHFSGCESGKKLWWKSVDTAYCTIHNLLSFLSIDMSALWKFRIFGMLCVLWYRQYVIMYAINPLCGMYLMLGTTLSEKGLCSKAAAVRAWTSMLPQLRWARCFLLSYTHLFVGVRHSLACPSDKHCPCNRQMTHIPPAEKQRLAEELRVRKWTNCRPQALDCDPPPLRLSTFPIILTLSSL